jgi:hypothetical protein
MAVRKRGKSLFPAYFAEEMRGSFVAKSGMKSFFTAKTPASQAKLMGIVILRHGN